MSRLYKAGDTYSKSFTVCNSTGAAANADSAPTGTILLNGASDVTVVTITNPATGQYKATASALPGTAGDVIELLIAATVGGVATKAIVDAIRLVAFSPSNTTSLGLTNLDAAISSRSTYAGGAVASVTAAVTVGTNNDKTGYKLASDGLDSISTTAPSGVASNFREMMVQVWRRFFRKTTKTSTQVKTYADDGTTVVTTQTVSDDGSTQTQGAAS